MAACLVTGGAGFIGSHLVEALLGRGHEVRVLDNFSTGSADNLASIRHRIELVEGDLTQLNTVRRAVRDMEMVFHQGALAAVPRSIADPMSTHAVCATGTLHVLLASRELGVRRVIYAASSSAYGALDQLPKRESHATLPLSPYAVAKLAGEQYCVAFTNVYGLDTVRLRYFNVYGPRQSSRSAYAAVIPLFLQAMLDGKRPTIYGDGHQSRDFTFISDVIAANLLAAEAVGVSGKVYNIAGNTRTSLLELVTHLNKLINTSIEPIFAPPRLGDVRHSQGDITAAQCDLGYRPAVSITEGLRRCLHHVNVPAIWG